MKQELNPKILIGVVLVGVLILAFVGYRAWTGPSVTPAPEVANAASGASGVPNSAPRGSGLRADTGGPTADALKYRDEYNRTHPGAAGSR